MSRGVQHRSWASKPVNRALMQKVKSAHFFHSFGLSGNIGLTYQSCRFCGEAAFRHEDREHGECTMPKYTGSRCRGLWRYAVRHYVCSDCRKDIVIGLPPAKSRSKESDRVTFSGTHA
jgi:hypothetical protein